MIGALAVTGLLFAGCTIESTPDRAVPSRSNDRATVSLAWSTLSTSEQAAACDGFWVIADDELIDYLMSPPDAMSRDHAEAFVDLLWERC